MIGPFVNDQSPIRPGTIAVWNGSLDNLPEGWVFCDGANGTPDLRNRMMKCVPNGSTDPGATGGRDSYTLSNAQLPSHQHNGTTTTNGSHNHGNGTGNAGSGSSTAFDASTGGGYTSSSDGSHNHTLSIGSAGSSSTIGNLPGYQEVNYIMKL